MAVTSQPYGVTIADDADVSAGIGTSTAISPTQIGLIPNLPFAGFILTQPYVGSSTVAFTATRAFGGTITSITNDGVSATVVFTFTSAQPNTNYKVYSGNVVDVTGPGSGITSKTTTSVTLSAIWMTELPSPAIWGAQGLVLFYPEDLR